MSAYSQNARRVFTMAPAKDDTETILTARMEVLTDVTLSDGAARLFALLMDFALNPMMHNGQRGSVSLSIKRLACLIGSSEKAVNSWKAQLLERRYLWKAWEPFPNMWSQNRYFIAALVPQDSQNIKSPNPGIFWGNGIRRGSAPQPGSRNLAGKFYSGVDELGASKIAENKEFSTVATSEGSPSAVKSTCDALPTDGAQPYQIHASAVDNTAVAGTKDMPSAVLKSSRQTKKTSVFSTEEKETLRDGEIRREGEKRVAPLRFPTPQFEPLDKKAFSRERQAQGKAAIDDCKKEINRIENDPYSKHRDGRRSDQAQAAINANKARIAEVNAWMVGRRTA